MKRLCLVLIAFAGLLQAGGPPKLLTVFPPAVDAGEEYELQIEGKDLAKATALEFFPGAGVTVRDFKASAKLIRATVELAPGVAPGVMKVAAVAPNGRSNELEIQASAADPAFVLSSMTVGAPTEEKPKISGHTFTISGKRPSGDTLISVLTYQDDSNVLSATMENPLPGYVTTGVSSIPVTVHFSDQNAAMGKGPVTLHFKLDRHITGKVTAPHGLDPGAKEGTLTFNLWLPAGLSREGLAASPPRLAIRLEAPKGRKSNVLSSIVRP